MLQGVQVLNALGRLVTTFYLEELISNSKYVIKSSTGEGPVKANVVTTVFGSSDGEFIQSTSIPKRNLVLTLGYNPDYASDETVEDLRQDLYAIVPPGASVRLRFLNDKMETVEGSGVVESLEPVLWTDTPEVQLSVILPLPTLDSLSTITLTGTQASAIPIAYSGTAKTGFVLDITARAAITAISVNNGVDPLLQASVSLASGDKVSISTVKGARYIRKNGTSILGNLTQGDLFMTLNPLVTNLKVNTSSNAAADVSINYKTRYVGV